jgi:glycerate kinase
MRLVCPTAFKGTLSPAEAARLLMEPGDVLLPLSDGGDGFLDCIQADLGGTVRMLPAADAFGRVRDVPVLELPDGTVVVESAKVIGMAGLEELDPFLATSKGLGDLLAQLQDAPRLWIGLGGTATMDGGAEWPTLKLPPTTAFCDVEADLLEAPRLFGPQKGAQLPDIPILVDRLKALGLPRGPHTGAAGGLGAKLKSLGARLVDGADELMRLVHFDEACHDAEAVITGEGQLDATTLRGKLPWRVAGRAHVHGLPVIGHFGGYGPGWEAAAEAFDELHFGDPRHEERLLPMI